MLFKNFNSGGEIPSLRVAVRGPALIAGDAGICAVLQEHPDGIVVPPSAGIVQRRAAELIPGIYICAGFNEYLDYFCMVFDSSGVQGSPVVFVFGIHVCPCSKKDFEIRQSASVGRVEDRSPEVCPAHVGVGSGIQCLFEFVW